MATIGYHASHEQFPPSELLACVRAAEQAGFAAAMCSDHFAPWSERQGHSGFAWSWLGAALQATSLPFGVVNAPGNRYHPAIVAQAAATLEEMFPGRFWVALGTGQAINEHITGARWPPKEERNARLRECVDVIRALWAGETVTHDSRIQVEEARLWTLPMQPPMIVGPALSEETSEFAGSWADAFITINAPRDRLMKLVEAFRRGGGEGKPLYLQCHLSYAGSEDEALANAYDQWRTPIFPGFVNEDLRTPLQLEAAARFVRPEDVAEHVRISDEAERHLEWLRGDLELGFEHVYLHNVGRNQKEFIEVFGEQVLPALG
ncbi:MAG TPA: TIGR03885 family FMN-dependent LLM class oxidoreductase [Thermomicrobiales bacterium]|nr:TIGR03885 family FMN-dependent LLM class oxidoreductase [Thermomicrobiales bacterium]